MSQSIGKKIKKIRKKRGMNQYEFAELIGLCKSTISKYENDKLSVPIDNLKKISDVFNVPMNEFFSDETEYYEEPVRYQDPVLKDSSTQIIKDNFYKNAKPFTTTNREQDDLTKLRYITEHTFSHEFHESISALINKEYEKIKEIESKKSHGDK